MKDELKQFYKKYVARDNGIAPLSDDAKLRVKNEILSKLGNQSINPSIDNTETWLQKIRNTILRSYVLVPALLLIFITGTTVASADALPGETLYPVKRQVENARLFIAPTEESKLNLQVNFAQKRLEESRKIESKQSKSNDTQNVNGDGNNESEVDSDTRGGNKSSNIRERQEKAREQADRALKFLDQTKEDWHQKGQEDKARQIEERIKEFRKDQEERNDRDQNRGSNDEHEDSREDSNGEVRGDNTDLRINNFHEDN